MRNRQIRASIFAVILFALSLAAAPQGPASEDLGAKVLPSLVSISIETPDGRTTRGTGFLTLKDGILAVAWHKVKDARRVTARFSNGEEYECSGIIDKDEKRNVALVRIKVFGRPVLALSAAEPRPGSPVAVAAVKDGAFGMIQASVVGLEVLDGVKFGTLSGDFPDGNNGSPVVDAGGAVVGLLVYRAAEGGSIPAFLPAAYILGLDATLPTQPWNTAAAAPAAPAPPDAVDADIVAALIAAHDRGAEIIGYAENIYAWSKYGQVDNGIFLKLQAVLDNEINQLDWLKTADPLRAKIIQATAQMLVKEKAALDFIIQCNTLLKGNIHDSPVAKEAGDRALGSARSVADQMTFMKPDISRLAEISPAFSQTLTVEMRYALGLAERKSRISLGAYAGGRRALYLIYCGPGLATKLGLRGGDLILSAGGREFQDTDDIEDFKLLLEANAGKTLEAIVERGGKRKPLTLKVPADVLTKYAR